MSEDGDIQGWWEVPSIAHFCSLFRIAFNLLDFDIEDLEEAVLTDAMDEADRGTNPLRLTDLIVRLLQGILEDGSVDKNNYSRHLRKLLQNRWQEEENRANPLSNDKMHFKDLPLRTKVEILHALCDFRLESEDVQELIRNFEAESLRVVPLGKDDKGSTYWYFYGTRLYREDPPPPEDEPGSSSPKRGRPTKKKPPPPPPPNPKKKSISLPIPPRAKWKVVCFTQEDWESVAKQYASAKGKLEKELYTTLTENFLPEIPRLFAEKERIQKKRMMETLPRRTSSRIERVKASQEEREKREQRKRAQEQAKAEEARRREEKRLAEEAKRQKEEEEKAAAKKAEEDKKRVLQKKEDRAKRVENRSRSRSEASSSEEEEEGRSRGVEKVFGRRRKKSPIRSRSSSSEASSKEISGTSTRPVIGEAKKTGKRKIRGSHLFAQSYEELRTSLYKVIEHIKSLEDAEPFLEPVDEADAPNYYKIITKPMDLSKMETKLDRHEYLDFESFEKDYKQMIQNCKTYNGPQNESWQELAEEMMNYFSKAVAKFVDRGSSSDEEILVEDSLGASSNDKKAKEATDSGGKGTTKKRGRKRKADPTEEDSQSVSSTKKSTSKSSTVQKKRGRKPKGKAQEEEEGRESKGSKKKGKKGGEELSEEERIFGRSSSDIFFFSAEEDEDLKPPRNIKKETALIAAAKLKQQKKERRRSKRDSSTSSDGGSDEDSSSDSEVPVVSKKKKGGASVAPPPVKKRRKSATTQPESGKKEKKSKKKKKKEKGSGSKGGGGSAPAPGKTDVEKKKMAMLSSVTEATLKDLNRLLSGSRHRQNSGSEEEDVGSSSALPRLKDRVTAEEFEEIAERIEREYKRKFRSKSGGSQSGGGGRGDVGSTEEDSSDESFTIGGGEEAKKKKHHHKKKHHKKDKKEHHRKRNSSGKASGAKGGPSMAPAPSTSSMKSPSHPSTSSSFAPGITTGPGAPEKKKDFRSRLKEGTWKKIMQGIAKAGKMHDPKLDSLISRVKELKEHRVQEKLEQCKKENEGSHGASLGSGSSTSASSLNMGTVLTGSDVLDKEKKAEEESLIRSEDVKEEEKAGNKATPNLSAWFKAFGAPKKSTPVAKVKPTTPVVAKQVAPWAYSKMENERRKSTEDGTPAPAPPTQNTTTTSIVSPTSAKPPIPPPPDPKRPLPSPSASGTRPSGPDRSPAYHPSPARSEVHSPMYQSSESDRSPQTPGYNQGGTWSTQPSPIPEQRSPATPGGGGPGPSTPGNGTSFIGKMPPPPKVGFYQEAGPKTPVSPAVAPISPSVQSPHSVGVTSPATMLPVNSPKHENLAALSQSALSSKGYDHYSPQYNPISPKTSPYGPPTPSATNSNAASNAPANPQGPTSATSSVTIAPVGSGAPVKPPVPANTPSVSISQVPVPQPPTSTPVVTSSSFPNYYQTISRQRETVAAAAISSNNTKAELPTSKPNSGLATQTQSKSHLPNPSPISSFKPTTSSSSSSTLVTPVPTPPFPVPTPPASDPAALLASLSQLVTSRLPPTPPIQPSPLRDSPIITSMAAASSSFSLSASGSAIKQSASASKASGGQLSSGSSTGSSSGSQFGYPSHQYPQYPGPFAGQWPTFPTSVTTASPSHTSAKAHSTSTTQVPQQSSSSSAYSAQQSQALSSHSAQPMHSTAKPTTAHQQSHGMSHQTATLYQQRFPFQQQTYDNPMSFSTSHNSTSSSSARGSSRQSNSSATQSQSSSQLFQHHTQNTSSSSSSYDPSSMGYHPSFPFHPSSSPFSSTNQSSGSKRGGGATSSSSKSSSSSNSVSISPLFQSGQASTMSQRNTQSMSNTGNSNMSASTSSSAASSGPFSTGPYSNLGTPPGGGLPDPHTLSRHSPYISALSSSQAMGSTQQHSSSSSSSSSSRSKVGSTPSSSSTTTTTNPSTSTTGYSSGGSYADYSNQYNPFAAFGSSGLRQPFPLMDPTIYQQYMQRQQEEMFLRNPLMQQQFMQQQASMGYNPMLAAAQLRGVIRPGWP